MSTTKMDLSQQLQEHFGWSDFKDGQVEIIQRLLDGKSTLAVFPTGGGKSLCYQFPALMLDGLTVVVSPLIALMKDQIDQLKSRGIKAVRFDSSLTQEEFREASNAIRSGEAKMLYVAPERFFNERFRSSLNNVHISLFAIDEAHCISQWGHNFRPDYLKLARIAKELKAERVLALTATATPAVRQDIRAAFDIAEEDAICTKFFRPNLHLQSEIVTPSNRVARLTELIRDRDAGSTIVYVTLQKTAEQVAESLAAAGLNAKAYHAGMESEQRHGIQDWFMNEQTGIVVATIAFGMGIDKSDIRYVYHFNPPKSIESYSQEIGRAGRDGETSACHMLLVPEDRIQLENFVYGDTPTHASLRQMMEIIDRQADEFHISHYTLASQSDMKVLVVRTLLTYLELDGYLQSTSPRYDEFSFKPLVKSSEILNAFEGERKEFVKKVLSVSRKSKVWCYLDINEAMQAANCDWARVVSALDYFAECGWLELRVSGLVHGYRRPKPIEDREQLTQEYVERTEQREDAEVDRVQQVLEMASAHQCLSSQLSEYFGQPMSEPCGTCTHCLGQGPLEIPEPNFQPLSDHLKQQVQQLVGQQQFVLSSPRAVARFMCGMTSPALTRAKLSKHALFGCGSEIPFGELLQEAEQLAAKPA